MKKDIKEFYESLREEYENFPVYDDYDKIHKECLENQVLILEDLMGYLGIKYKGIFNDYYIKKM